MKKWLFFSLAGGVALLLVVSGIWLGFGPGIVKNKLVEAVYNEKQRGLRIDGQFQLQLLPQPMLEVGRLHLSAAGKQDVFMDVGQLKASVRFWPLLRGRVIFDELVVDDVQLQLVRFADGTTNFDDLLASSSSTQGPDIFVENLKLSNVQIGWQDDLAGTKLGLRHANLELGPVGKESQGELHAQGTFAMHQGIPDLNFELGSRYRIMAAQQKLELEAVKFQVSGDWMPEALSGGVEAPKANGGGLGFQVDLSAPGAVWEGNKASVPSLLTHLNVDGAELKGDVSLSLAQLQFTPARLEIGRGGLDLDIHWRNLAVVGSGGSTVHYDFAAQKLDIPAISGELEVSYPDFLTKALVLDVEGLVQADMAQGQSRGEVQLALGESHLTGAWLLNRLPFPVLAFEGSLDRLNLDQYLRLLDASGSAGAVSKGGAPSVRNWRAEDTGENRMEVRGRLQVGELHYRYMKIKNLESRLIFKNGRLDIDSQTVGAGDVSSHPSEAVLP